MSVLRPHGSTFTGGGGENPTIIESGRGGGAYTLENEGGKSYSLHSITQLNVVRELEGQQKATAMFPFFFFHIIFIVGECQHYL